MVEQARSFDRPAGPFRGVLVPRQLRHLVSSGIGAAFWLLFAYVNIRASIDSHRVIGLGVGALGLLTAVLFLVRRPARYVTTNAIAWAIAFAGTFGASVLRPGGDHPGWLDLLGLTLQVLGLVLGVLGFLTLRRSLGLVPAHRGLVTSGVYGVVRHPLYISYVAAELGYLAQSPRLWNLAVLAFVWVCQLLRIMREERLLSEDPEYRGYMERTRWRLMPGVW
jgi:protein-S-isoprenylcysteine O-methyltransferase Ste14